MLLLPPGSVNRFLRFPAQSPGKQAASEFYALPRKIALPL